MRLSDLLSAFGRDANGYRPEAALAVRYLTINQIESILRDPKTIAEEEADEMTERDWHREHAMANCWPEWLESKLWRERHREP